MNRLRYFDGITTLRGAHQRYRLLAKKLHPDAATGNTEWFREMAEEYALVQDWLRSKRSDRPSPVPDDVRTSHDNASPPPPVSVPPESHRIGAKGELSRAVSDLANAAGSVLAAWLKTVLR